MKPVTRSMFKHPEAQGKMYTVQWPPFDNTDVENKIDDVRKPLSLFAPFPHEDIQEEDQSDMTLERPVTPIDEEIKLPPSSFEKLASFIRRRLSPRPNVLHLSFEDQQLLAGILVGEVTGIWPEIRKQKEDPFLTQERNKELNRRVAVHIVTVCEKLFEHYLKKAEVLNSRGIFSGPANMSRLKAQLSLDANKFLNLSTIRRYLVEDMREKSDSALFGDDDMYDDFPPRASTHNVQAPKMSYKALIETSRPRSKLKRFKFKTPETEAKMMLTQMPSLDMTKVAEFGAQLPERLCATPSEASVQTSTYSSEADDRSSETPTDEGSNLKLMLKRSNSLPNIQSGETLVEELGIDKDSLVNALDQDANLLQNKSSVTQQDSAVKKEPAKPGTREYVWEDLQSLIKKPDKEKEVEEDMPPLLQAICTHARHDGMEEVLEKRKKELEEKEQKEFIQRSVPLKKPKHPQPSTVKTKIDNQMDVRASDIRVSERVCMSSVTLNRFSTVYDDLNEEIDAATVKHLDKNLFLGDEIKEVYQEIMRTIPTTHLLLDDDESVVPAAETVNMSGTMSSSSLVRRCIDRVINPAFIKANAKAPWGETDQKQWVKTPNNPPKNFQGEDIFQPLDDDDQEILNIKRKLLKATPNMDKVHEVLRHPGKTTQTLTATEEFPSYGQDKMSRTYASWLQWWKSTITSDDYLKYLSTQETDYMAVVFHFYDSEDEDDEGVVTGLPATLATNTLASYKPMPSGTTRVSKQTVQKAKEKKLQEMKTEKTKYEEGFWNVNSIMLGGLGKEPVLDTAVDDNASGKTPRSADTTRSAKTLQEKAAARHSAKMEKSRLDTQSRMSKVTSLTSISKAETGRSSSPDETEGQTTAQQRLEKVWAMLEMPDNLKLDMAIKYSGNEFYPKLEEAMDRWEKVTELISKREQLLVKLEKFERTASDPNRFFEKGKKRSSVQRLKEAQQRSYYYKRIDTLDADIKEELTYLHIHFRDTITYKGRPYLDKMKWDRIEMIHWLQEERKQNAIKYEMLLRDLPANSTHLEPITLAM